MILAAGTTGTIIATVAAFLIITLLLVYFIVSCKTKIITIRSCKDYD